MVIEKIIQGINWFPKPDWSCFTKKPAYLKGSSEDHDDSEDELKKEDITFGGGGGGGGGGSGRDVSSSRAASSRSRGPPPFERSISLTPGALLSRESWANSSSTTAAGTYLDFGPKKGSHLNDLP